MNGHHQKSTPKASLPRSRTTFSRGFNTLPLPSSADLSTPPRREGRVWRAIERIPFGWDLGVVLPSFAGGEASELPVELEELVRTAGGFYYAPAVNLADLLEPGFLNSYVRTGSLIALSTGDTEGEDVVCIDGKGRLILNVSKDTYEVLGLPGRPSLFGSLGHQFVVEIPLSSPSFRSDSTLYARTSKLLRAYPSSTSLFPSLSFPTSSAGRAFPMLFAFVSSSGIPTPISFPPSITATLHHPTLTTHSLSPIRVPLLSSLPAPTSSKHIIADTPSALREWIGLVSLGAQVALQADDEEGDEVIVEGEVVQHGLRYEAGSATSLTWTGFFHPSLCTTLLSHLFYHTPFSTLSLRPPPHSPLGHLSARKPGVGTRVGDDGRRVKRGRGAGEEEEGGGGGWEVVLRREGEGVEWVVWEEQ